MPTDADDPGIFARFLKTPRLVSSLVLFPAISLRDIYHDWWKTTALKSDTKTPSSIILFSVSSDPTFVFLTPSYARLHLSTNLPWDLS